MRRYYFVLDSKMVECHHVIYCLALKSIEILHREYVVLIPLELEAWPIRHDALHVALVQKIVNPLFVYLQVRAVYREFLLLQVGLLPNEIEEQPY